MWSLQVVAVGLGGLLQVCSADAPVIAQQGARSGVVERLGREGLRTKEVPIRAAAEGDPRGKS